VICFSQLARPSWGACALLCGDNDCSHARKQCQLMPKQCRGVALMSDSKFKVGVNDFAHVTHFSVPNQDVIRAVLSVAILSLPYSECQFSCAPSLLFPSVTGFGRFERQLHVDSGGHASTTKCTKRGCPAAAGRRSSEAMH